jgi:hypothetical protein
MTEYTTITVRGEKLPAPPRAAVDRDHRSDGQADYRPDGFFWEADPDRLTLRWDDGEKETALTILAKNIDSVKIAWPEAGDG